jgi:hypothetical protein
MSGKTNETFRFFKSLILLLSGASLIIFLVAAAVSSLFGYSLWSWVNVLRFVLGGFIVLILIAYFAIIRLLVQSAFKRE